MFKVLNKVNKKELKDSLKQSIELNKNALDYLKNKKNVVSDMSKYNEEDKSLKEELATLEYIEFTLKYVGTMYEENLLKV